MAYNCNKKHTVSTKTDTFFVQTNELIRNKLKNYQEVYVSTRMRVGSSYLSFLAVRNEDDRTKKNRRFIYRDTAGIRMKKTLKIVDRLNGEGSPRRGTW